MIALLLDIFQAECPMLKVWYGVLLADLQILPVLCQPLRSPPAPLDTARNGELCLHSRPRMNIALSPCAASVQWGLHPVPASSRVP